MLPYSVVYCRALSPTVTLRGGASSIDARAGVVHSGYDDVVTSTNFASSFDSDGSTAELVFTVKTGRQLWLRLE